MIMVSNKITRKYLISFLCGANILIFAPYILFRFNPDYYYRKQANYRFELYIIIGPLYFGVMNMLALYLSERYVVSKPKSYLFIILLATFITTLASYYIRAYRDVNYKKGSVVLGNFMSILFIYTLTFIFIGWISHLCE